MTRVVALPARPAAVAPAPRFPTIVERTARADADAALNRAADSFADLLVLRAATFESSADMISRERDAIAGIITELQIARARLNDLVDAR